MLKTWVVVGCVLVLSCGMPDRDHRDARDAVAPSSTANQAPPPEVADSVLMVADSSAYIGDISAFEATGEYYTSIYYLPDLPSSVSHEHLSGLTDALVYEDDEVRRTSLPLAIARKYFNLARLERISLFGNATYLGEAELVRVELLEDLIESEFIAVFRPVHATSFNADVSYCISSGEFSGSKVEISWEPFEDNTLTKRLVQTFRMKSDPWNAVHVKTMPDDVTFSGLTFASRSVLIETAGGRSTIVKDINRDYYISDILPLHLEADGRPILLLRMGINETDISWTSLAVYSRDTYQLRRGNRLEGEVYL